jgi:hypothetical protein
MKKTTFLKLYSFIFILSFAEKSLWISEYVIKNGFMVLPHPKMLLLGLF